MNANKKADVMQAFAARLKAAMDHAGLPHKKRGSPARVAEELQVNHKAVRKWLAGESMPDMAHAVQLANFLGVSFDWLAAGQGDMLPFEGLEPDGLTVALNWPRLTDDTQTTIKKLVQIGLKQGHSYAVWQRNMAEKPPPGR